MLLSGTFAIVWLLGRRRLVPFAAPSPEERLAGLATALGALGLVALALALWKPYALVFVLPSLYAWLWLPLEGRLWQRMVLFGLGLAGPAFALLVLGNQLAVSVIGAALYLVGLTTVGYVSLGAALLVLAWFAAAAQVAALAFGRYAPYAGGEARPHRARLRRLR